MSKTRIAINGMGRIGRTLIREWADRKLSDFEIVAVNNPGNPLHYTRLLKYDSVHGKAEQNIKLEGEKLYVGSHEIHFHGQRDPNEISWSDQDVDIVIDSSGRFRDSESLKGHLKGSVKKVVLCAPGKVDATFVMGINHEDYDPSTHHILSNASCTTNCLAPVAKVLHEQFKIQRGYMTTVHAYTSDQSLLDSAHKDARRARAAGLSMIPTTTGAAKAIGQVIPSLAGKLDGFSVRVPTPNVSLVDLTVNVEAKVSIEAVNKALKEAALGSLKGILEYTDEELVSIDYNGMRASSCVDGQLTNCIENAVKVISWYDNEVGFSNRVLDLTSYIASKL